MNPVENKKTPELPFNFPDLQTALKDIKFPLFTESKTDEKEESLRLKLLPTLIAPLNLPPFTYEMEVNELILCLFLNFFHKCQGFVEDRSYFIHIASHFLGQLKLNTFGKDNGERIDLLFQYLSKDKSLKTFLEQADSQSFKRAMRFLTTGRTFSCKILSVLLAKRTKVEHLQSTFTASPSAESLPICQFILNCLETYIFPLVDHLDEGLIAIQKYLDPKAKKREIELFCQQRNSHPLFKELLKDKKQFYLQIEKLVSIFRLRRKLFMEQMELMQEIIKKPTPLAIKTLCSLLRRMADHCEGLTKQSSDVSLSLHHFLEVLSPYLTEEQEDAIQKEFNTPLFLEMETAKEKEQEKKHFVKTEEKLFETLADTLVNPPPMLQNTENLEEMTDLFKKISSLVVETNNLNKTASHVLTTLKKHDELKKKYRERIQSFIQNGKGNRIENQLYHIQLSYSTLLPLKVMFYAFSNDLNVVRFLLNAANKYAQKIICETETPSITPFDYLFEPQTKSKKRYTPSYSPIEINDEPESETPLPSTKKKTPKSTPLQNPLLSLQKSLKSLGQAEGPSKDAFQNGAFHLGSLRLFLQLSRKCSPQQREKFLPLFQQGFVRCCALVSEQLMTGQLLQQKPDLNFLTHSHLELAKEIGFHKQPDYLNLINHGVITHRYPNSSALYLSKKGIPFPHSLEWLLNPQKGNFEQLMNLAEETVQFVYEFSNPGEKTKAFLSESPKSSLNMSSLSNYISKNLESVLERLKSCSIKLQLLLTKMEQCSDSLMETRLAVWKDAWIAS